MAESTDLQGLMVEAFKDAKKQIIEVSRAIKSEVVTRPADPNATKISGQDARLAYQVFKTGPELESKFFELQEKFKLGDTAKPIPRRLIQYILDEERKAKKAQ